MLLLRTRRTYRVRSTVGLLFRTEVGAARFRHHMKDCIVCNLPFVPHQGPHILQGFSHSFHPLGQSLHLLIELLHILLQQRVPVDLAMHLRLKLSLYQNGLDSLGRPTDLARNISFKAMSSRLFEKMILRREVDGDGGRATVR